MAKHSVCNAVSSINAYISVDEYLLTNLSVQKFMAKFDQLWTELDNGMESVIREGNNEGYKYEEISGT